jgi:hypothetical protein
MGYRYFKQIGVPSPGTSFVEVTLEIEGHITSFTTWALSDGSKTQWSLVKSKVSG